MKKTSIKFFLILLSCGLGASNVFAQINLATYVNDPANGASDLQVQAGNAVQRACGALAGEGGFNLTGVERDLFLRCNELVQTSQALQGVPDPQRNMGLTDPEMLAAVQNITGEELHTQTTLSTRVTSGQFSNIAGRLNAMRLGVGSAAMGGRLASAGPFSDPDRNAPGFQNLSMDTRGLSGGAAAADDISGSRVGWFIEGSFNTGDRDETAAEDGFDFDSTSVTLGLDYLMDSGVIGFSVGLDNYEADFNQTMLVQGGKVEVEGTSGSIFGALFRGNLYLDGIVSYGNLDSDTTRRAFYPSDNTCPAANPCPGEDDTLIGETEGDYIAAGATLGFDTNRGNWDISTTVSVAYRDIELDGYNESDPAGGGLSLAYDKQEIESLRSVLGVAFTGTFSRDWGILSPHFRLEWHHEFEDDPGRLMAKYAVEEQLAAQGVMGAAGAGVFSLDTAQCISCFVVNSDEIDTDFGLVGIGVSAVFSRRVQFYAVYDTLLGLDNLTSHSIALGLRGQF
jgi:uncharacterized protein YhjY with autotransporter beta-barrel domain